jgi:LmbE family N-acetylglucosaminyl deacetylase
VRRNAGLPDAALENTPASRARVAGLIRELRPTVVVTHWREGRHPDHRIASSLAYDACYLAGLKNLDTPGVSAPAFRPEKVVYATAFREDADPPSFVVDVTDVMDARMKALEAYDSQFGGKTAMGEVFPGGERPLFDQVRAHCARYGSLIRVAYGEPFRTREALAVGSLTDLEVSTF